MVWLYVLYICRSCELLDQCGFENERRRKGARPGVQRPATGTQGIQGHLGAGAGLPAQWGSSAESGSEVGSGKAARSLCVR